MSESKLRNLGARIQRVEDFSNKNVNMNVNMNMGVLNESRL